MVNWLVQYISKFRTNEKSPPPSKFQFALISALGAFSAIGTITLLTQSGFCSLILAPFGATCALAFGAPASPFAQPRNILGGYVICGLLGILCFKLFGYGCFSMAMSVAVSIFCMLLLGMMHPPAAAVPMIAVLTSAGFAFLWQPVFLGALVISLVALLFNNLILKRKYPHYW